MIKLFRRVFWLALLAGAGYATWTTLQRRNEVAPAAAPEWPPIEPPPAPAPNWVEPVDGACPDTHPIKVNDKSGIFHSPGGRFYDRTVPERCYARTEDAAADGYRAAKA